MAATPLPLSWPTVSITTRRPDSKAIARSRRKLSRPPGDVRSVDEAILVEVFGIPRYRARQRLDRGAKFGKAHDGPS